MAATFSSWGSHPEYATAECDDLIQRDHLDGRPNDPLVFGPPAVEAAAGS